MPRPRKSVRPRPAAHGRRPRGATEARNKRRRKAGRRLGRAGELELGVRVEDGPDAERGRELELLRILGRLFEADAVRGADDGSPADTRQERRKSVGVGGIAQKELTGPNSV